LTVEIAGSSLAWTQVTDVVVVGSGASGLVAAISAAEAGARVLVCEKGAVIGGTSRKGEGGWWVPNNRFMRALGLSDTREDFLRFCARTSRPDRYNPQDPTLGLPRWEFDLHSAFYDNAAPVFERLEELGAIAGFHLADFPDYMSHLPEDVAKRGHLTIPRLPSGEPGTGLELIRRLVEACTRRGVQITTGQRVTGVLTDPDGTVLGVRFTGPERSGTIRANRGVVFASGGFTHHEELRANLATPAFGGGAVVTNEGDFVPIAQRLGAAMRNMGNAWMSPIILERALRRDPDLKCVFIVVGDSILLVNRYGRRGLDEKMVYNERGLSMGQWDGIGCEYPNLLMFPIWDQRCQDRFAGGAWDDGTIAGPGQDDSHVIVGQTLEELADNLRGRVDALAEHTGAVRLADDFTEQLRATVERFNGFARLGVDQDFHRGETPIEQFFHAATSAAAGVAAREAGEQTAFSSRDQATAPATAAGPAVPNPTMYPLADAGPYYAAIHAPGTLDTKGGPATDPHGRVLREDGSVIAGLYAVGNCAASASARGYLGPGITIGPLITFGWLAGQHAAGGNPAALLAGYDPFDEEIAPRKWEILDYARRRCPVAHTAPRTDPGVTYYMLSRYRDVRYVLEHPEIFSSRQSALTQKSVRMAPIDYDPPVQQEFRKLLNPLFSRSALLRFEPRMRDIARAAIAGFVDRGEFEFVSEFAIPFSAGVLSRVIFDEHDQGRVRETLAVVSVLAADPSPEAFGRLAALAGDYLAKKVRSGARPADDDVLATVVAGRLGDRPLTPEEQISVITVLFLAGLDTTRGALGNIAANLARHPDLETRLRDPRWIRHDMDEFLRYESPVAIMARTVVEEVELAGHRFQPGDRVMVNYGAANRDPTQFREAQRLDFELARPGNMAFGLGVHRCLGSHLARLQLEIGWHELLKQITHLRLPDGHQVRYDTGMVHGPAELPLTFDRTTTEELEHGPTGGVAQ
jgi:cytochrome P450